MKNEVINSWLCTSYYIDDILYLYYITHINMKENKLVELDALTARQKVEMIRFHLNTGMKYNTAQKLAQPYIDIMNRKAREIAKQFCKKHRDFTFSQLMR